VCYLKGAPKISEAICGEYGIKPGGTTADRLFTLQAVNCVGACALAPVMVVDGKYYDGVTPDSALKLLRGLAAGPGAEPGTKPPGAAAASKPRAASKSAGSAAKPAKPTKPAAESKPSAPAAKPAAKPVKPKPKPAAKKRSRS